MPTNQALADWRKAELTKLAVQLKILRRKVEQGKGWPGIKDEIAEKEAEYRAHILSQEMENE